MFSRVLILLLGYSFFMAIVSIIAKFTLSGFDFFSYYAWSLIGSFLGGILMLFRGKTRRNFFADMESTDRKIFIYSFMTCSIFYIGELSIVIAISLASVSIVSALTALHPLFTLAFVSTLSFFGVKSIKEELKGINLHLKILAIGLIFIGTYFLATL